MKFFYFVLLFLIRFLVYLYRRFRRRSNKIPQPLRCNVQLTNGKRSASVSSSAPTGVDKRRKMFVPKASGPKKPQQKGGFNGAKKPGSRK
jgi:hypothetical protein